MLDFCFLLNHFVKPLPSSLLEFKTLMMHTWDSVFDTKLICSLPNGQSGM